MGREITDTDKALLHADRVDITFRALVCADCEDQCYALVIGVQGDIGGQLWAKHVHRRDHLTLQHVMEAAGRWLLAAGGRERDRQAAAWLIEHQPTLW